MSLTPQALKVAASLYPYPLTGMGEGVSDPDLADILGAWLADQFARDDHQHIHSWHEEDRQ